MKIWMAIIIAVMFYVQAPMAFPKPSTTEKKEKTEQTTVKKEKPKQAAKSVIDDIPIPDSPAFTILGLSPQNVTNPSSVRDLAATLINGVDRNGNFQSGIAIDTSILNLSGDQVSINDYNTNFINLLWYSSQISFATAKGSNDEDKSLRIAGGIKLTLFDNGDPRRENSPYITCVENIFSNYPLPDLDKIGTELDKEIYELDKEIDLIEIRLKPLQSTSKNLNKDKIKLLQDKKDKLINKLAPISGPNFNKTAENRYDAALKKYNLEVVKTMQSEEAKTCRSKKNWNRSRWVVAFAPSWISPTGDSEDLNWNGAGYWTSIVIGPDLFGFLKSEEDIEKSPFSNMELILHARYRSNEMTPDAQNVGAFLNQDTANVGAQIQYGISNNFILFGEGSFVHSNPDIGFTDNFYQYSAGLNFKVQDDLWLKLTYSGSSNRSNQPNQGSVLANLQWAFGQNP
jgi:hypothetical protein